MFDDEIADLTEDEAEREQERLNRRWANVVAEVGTEKRLRLVARDPGRALREPCRGHIRQGHDRLHESPDVRRTL